jgi:cell division transport system permease protein
MHQLLLTPASPVRCSPSAGLYAGKVLLLDGPLQALSKMMTPIPDGNLWLMLPLPAVAGAATSGIAAWITLRFHIRV